MLHRQINRPVITEICRLLEARRIQATLARENTNILGALVARQPIDVGDDLVFLSSGFDKFLRFVTDLVQQSPRFVHRAELPPSLYQPLRHDHRIASFPAHVRQRAFHFLQLRQRETAAGIHQADLCLGSYEADRAHDLAAHAGVLMAEDVLHARAHFGTRSVRLLRPLR